MCEIDWIISGESTPPDACRMIESLPGRFLLYGIEE
jgi:hypothetical protein